MEVCAAGACLVELVPKWMGLRVDVYIPCPPQLPTIIADNAGFDSVELVSQLRAAHTQGNKFAGLSMCFAVTKRGGGGGGGGGG